MFLGTVDADVAQKEECTDSLQWEEDANERENTAAVKSMLKMQTKLRVFSQ